MTWSSPAGEQVTSGLLAITLQGMGCQRAHPTWAGSCRSAPRGHAAALIDDIDADVLERVFAQGGIAVIPGFQGVTADGERRHARPRRLGYFGGRAGGRR